MAKVKVAYWFALEPTPAQERALRSHAGAARFAWNWGLAKCRERYAAERKWYSGAELHKLWNAQKKAEPGLAWWAENSKCAYQEAFRDLDRALGDFVKSRKGLRKGKKLGFPRYKKKGKARDSFCLTGTMRCAGRTLTLKDRIFACDLCGHTEDRDVNAARNLLSLAASGAERLNARGAALRPGPAGHAVLKRVPGSRKRDKTGTAVPQGAAAA